MMVDPLGGFCAMVEISELSDEKEALAKGSDEPLAQFCSGFYGGDDDTEMPLGAFVVFTEVTAVEKKDGKEPDTYIKRITGKYGRDFAKLIRKHGLGEVTVLRTRINPNHTNPRHYVRPYVWTVKQDKLKKWFLAYRETPAGVTFKRAKTRSYYDEDFF